MLSLNLIDTVAFAGVVILIGHLIRKHVRVLSKYSIPSPVIGGLLVAFTLFFLRDKERLPITFDTTLQSPLMIGFFASIGFSASFGLLRVGGKVMVMFFVATVVMLLIQNIVGLGVGVFLGQAPLFGLLCGSVTMAGGPATALAFGAEFEKAGLSGATAIGIAAAMLGIIMGGLLGNPIATELIRRNRLKEESEIATSSSTQPYSVTESRARSTATDAPFEQSKNGETVRVTDETDSGFVLLKAAVALLVAMWLGSWISGWIAQTGITLPTYIGAMLIAACIRNLDDQFHLFRLSPKMIDDLGNAALGLFLTLALMTLKVSEIQTLALPMIAILMVQAIVVALTSYFIIFRLMGKDYEAVVMTAGFGGFMLGTSANAMANMKSIRDHYGPAPRAFLVVPIIAAFLIDFTNAVVITFFLNLFKSL